MRKQVEKMPVYFYTEPMKRVIVHSDINHCYAQIEEMLRPQLRNVPMAVGGSEEKRNGIILAKNDLAKAKGIRTGESLREARRKCPDLLIIHPDYDAYIYYTEKIKDIYCRYTDRVESFGLDEAWIDLTHSQRLFGDGIDLARRIQDEVFETYGITVSMGVSFNKIFAKLASDLLKHKGFVVVTEDDFKEFIWPLPAEDLLMVGSRTRKKLNEMRIFTIGDLAKASPERLTRRFGVMGGLLWNYANGFDQSEVHLNGYKRPVKSVGNSKTVVHDITSIAQLQEVFRVLSESIAARLRNDHMKCNRISISLRSTELKTKGCQKKLVRLTDLASDILEAAMQLTASLKLEEICLRSVGISVSGLCQDAGFDQGDLFMDLEQIDRQRKMEQVLYDIRVRYGYDACRMASSQVDAKLTDFDPLGLLHNVHPIAPLDGPIEV